MKTTGSPQELASLYKRMAAAMAQLKRLPKRGRNTHFKYDYVTDSDVLDAVRGALGEAGVAFFVDTLDLEQDGKRTVVTLEVLFGDSETGASMATVWVGEALDAQDKGINKALTGAVKYGLLKTLLVSTGEDDPDGEQADDKGNGQKQAEDRHWIDRVDKQNRPLRNRFWAKTGELGLSHDEVYEALEVEHIHDFVGDMKEAMAKIDEYIAAHAKVDAAKLSEGVL